MSLWDTAKEHPYITGGVGLVAVIIVVMLLGSGGKDSGDGSSAYVPMGPVDTGTALQGINAQAATEAASISAQLDAFKIKSATDLSIATLQANSYDKSQALQADVMKYSINAKHTSDDLASTLAAQLEGNRITAQKEVALNNTNVAYNTEVLHANTNLALANYQYQTAVTNSISASHVADRMLDIANAQGAVSGHNADRYWQALTGQV